MILTLVRLNLCRASLPWTPLVLFGRPHRDTVQLRLGHLPRTLLSGWREAAWSRGNRPQVFVDCFEVPVSLLSKNWPRHHLKQAAIKWRIGWRGCVLTSTQYMHKFLKSQARRQAIRIR